MNDRSAKNGYYSRAFRKEQISAILASGQDYTTWELAKKLGMKPSTYLRNILCEMFGEGLINGYRKQPGKRNTFVWSIPQAQKLEGFK